MKSIRTLWRSSRSERVRDHIRSNVVGYIALLAVALGGTAQALPGRGVIDHDDLQRHVVHGPNIHDGAVGPAKLRLNAVRPRHITDGGIRTRHLAATIERLPSAGARISEDGVLETWFNRFGGRPSVEPIGVGHFRIMIPGLDTTLPPELPVMAALVESAVPAFATYQIQSDGSIDIFTWDAEGRPLGRGIDIAAIDGQPVAP